MSEKRIAVMQPYFFPYAGYFRLLATADEFVIFDCVQFPRRGRVHRCEVPGPPGAIEWLTLPLAKVPREAKIRDLTFAADARAELTRRLEHLPWYRTAEGEAADRIRAHLAAPLPISVVDFLEGTLRLAAALLNLKAEISRSSALSLAPALKSQARVIEIAKARGATQYVNAPGGRALYDERAFSAAGLGLSFLEPYEGRHRHLLPALMTRPLAEIAADVAR